MNNVLIMNRINLTSRIITGAALFLTLALPLRVSAACGADSVRWMWQHPAYAGLTWQRSADSLIADIPDALCGNSVLQAQFTGTKNLAYAVVQTAGGLQIASVDYYGKIGRCDIPLLAMNAPAAIPQSSGIGVWYLLRLATSPLDSVLIATVSAGPRVIVRRIRTATGAQSGADTLTLSALSGGAVVTGISGTSENVTASDSAILIFGTRGLLRRFSRSGISWSAEQILDIPNTENITAVCDSFIATASGYIWQRMGGGFSQQVRPVTTALRAITSRAAVGDNGAIIIRLNSMTWMAYTSGTASYWKFNQTKLPGGSAIELLDSNWRYAAYTYGNYPTDMYEVMPPGMGYYLNGPIYNYKGPAPETLTVYLGDMDSNFSMPTVMYNGFLDLRTKGSVTLQGAQPALACAAGTAQLAEGRIQILMKPDSVFLLASAYVGAYDPSCLWNYWSRQTFRNGERWSRGSQLTVKLPLDSIRLRFDTVPVTALSRAEHAKTGMSSVIISSGKNCFVLPVFGQNKVRIVRIFDPAGRILASAHPTSGNFSIPLNSATSSRMLYAQLVMTDGTVRSIPLPFVK